MTSAFRYSLLIVCLGAVFAACSSAQSETAEVPVDVATAVDEQPDGVATPIESTAADELRDLIRSDDPSTLTCVVGPSRWWR